VSQQSDPWVPLANDSKLREYGTLLYHFAHAILVTLEKGYSGYSFPLSADQQTLGAELMTVLVADTDLSAVQHFHRFISPVLFASEISEQSNGSGSKWENMIECLMAVKFIQEDGNFPQAKDITQPLAKLLYIIRGAVLYEGIITLDEHGHNLIK
jgi:hypothetical protein